MTDASEKRRSRQHLTDIEIAKILGLDRGGLTQRDIALIIGCSQKAVQNAVTTYVLETFQGRNQRRDYKRKTTVREDRYIKRALIQNHSVPLRTITNIVNNKVLPISKSTLARRRSEAGLGSYVAAEKPGLRAENVAKRLQWALDHKDWTSEQWKRVIWSDESSLWVGVNPRREWVIRPPGERLNCKYVKKTFKSAQVKVMVWACFTGERLGPLMVCDEGGIGANEYEDILYDGLFSLVDDLVGSSEEFNTAQNLDEIPYIFMQDNAPCHKATEILNFLAENEISLMEWPPQSPDLNPIENLWMELKVRFHHRFTELFNHPSKSLEARYRYGEILQEVWYSQGMELVEALIESMPRRCKAVIEAQGGWTKY
jgi:DDE superfamily endonuclease/Transposase